MKRTAHTPKACSESSSLFPHSRQNPYPVAYLCCNLVRNFFMGVFIMGFICSCCGHKSSSASSGSCSSSPSRNHIYMEASSGGYLCKFCGHASSSASSGSCSQSPHDKHMYISKHSGGYTCKYCGHKSSGASSGSCSKSPHKKHEYM